MKKKSTVLLYFIPLIYLAAIGLLLFLQFKPVQVAPFNEETEPKALTAQKTNEKSRFAVKTENPKKGKFSKKVGELLISGRKKINFDNDSAETDSISVAYNHLIFKFESKKECRFTDASGKESPLVLQKVLFDKQKLTLKCKNDITLMFQNNSDKTVSIYAQSKKVGGMVSVDLGVVNSASLFGESQSSTVIAVGKKQSTVLLQSANKKGDIVLSLPIEKGKEPECGARLVLVPNNDIWGAVADLHQKQDYETALQWVRNGFYRGWRELRYLPATQNWMLADSTAGVNPDLISALFTESYLRNRAEDFLNFLSEAGVYSYSIVNGQKYSMTVHPKAEAITTALIFGNMKSNWNRFNADAKNELFKFSNAVGDKNPSVFGNRFLVWQLALFGGQKELQSFEKSAAVAFKEAGAPLLSKVLILSKEYAALFPVSDDFKKAMKAGADRLAKSVSFSEKGVWVAVDGVVDTEASFTAGVALSYYGRDFSNSFWTKTAAAMMSSVATAVDSKGFLPQQLSFITLSPVGSQKLSTEKLYQWLVDLNYQPKLVRVRPKTGAPFFLLHRAEKATVTVGDRQVDFGFKRWSQPGAYLYPVGVLNLFYLAKLSGFEKIAMMNSPSWPADRTFESWRVGYYYWQEEQLLTAMLRHRTQTETFSVQWAPPVVAGEP